MTTATADQWWSDEAEEALLGACLISRDSIAVAAESVNAKHFFVEAHQLVWQAIIDLFDAGERPDVVSVAEHLKAHGLIDHIGGPPALVALQAGAGTVSNVPRYGAIVRDYAQRRRHRENLLGALEEDLIHPAEEIPELIRARLDRLEAEFGGGTVGRRGLASFRELDLKDERVDAIPGVLRRSQVAVVTGMPGQGKSLLSLQVALALGCGIHPLTLKPIERRRTLYVQLENDEVDEQDRIENMLAGRNGDLIDEDLVDVQIRPEGADLTSPDGRGWLRSLVRTWRPDVLVIGPYKNMHTDSIPGAAADRHAALASSVQRPLNDLRKEHGCAIWLEAHPTRDADMSSDTPKDFLPAGGYRMEAWAGLGLCLMPREQQDLFRVGTWREPRRADIELPRLMIRRRGVGFPWMPADGHDPD